MNAIIKRFLHLATLLSLIFYPIGALAISNVDRDAVLKNTPFYDPDSTGGTCTGAVLIGGNNGEIIWNYFRTKGLSEIQTAGIMGNLRRESGQDFSPTAVNPRSGATGIAQWLDPRLSRLVEYGELQGLDPFTLSVQLDFIWFEMTGTPVVEGASGGGSESRAYEDLITRTVVSEAAASFADLYERYGAAIDYTGSIPPAPGEEDEYQFAFNSPEGQPGGGPRIDFAEQIYAAFSGAPTPEGSSGGGCMIDSPLGPVDYSANPDVRVDGATRCISGPLQPGLMTLRQYILDRWSPEVTSIGDRAVCRSVVGGTSVSIHSEGRAIDVMVNAHDPAALQAGNEIRDWVILNSTNLGMQRVIWNRHTWSANQDGWRDYCAGQCTDQGGDRHPHEDHLHIELNWDGALEQTPFFTGGGTGI